MKHYYILSGYNRKQNMIRTRKFESIETVVSIVNYWHAKAGLKTFDNVDAFEAQVTASCANNGTGFPIDTNPLIAWNIYCV